MLTRSQILVRGIVQGVGFRPFIYSQASRRALRGLVRNNGSGVIIEVEGNPHDIEEFVRDIKSDPPPLSIIDSIECQNNLTLANYQEFRILESDANGERFVPVSPDIATCSDCLRELFDPRNRRHRYPFINCTNCGPRFTLIEDVPYDRVKTTMRDFEMCNECRVEYQNPLDRRFHAEPIACWQCGPQLTLLDSEGRVVASGDAVPDIAQSLIAKGQILAVKGIGGFHLVCDALNAQAVELVRRRKYREEKPFAMMAASPQVVENYCDVSAEERRLLLSDRRPIVLLERKAAAVISEAIAPGVNTLGFMLPYTPLHYLLLEDFESPMVFTSGNISDEPICYENDEALERLRGIADYFLLNDRRIRIREDDSVKSIRAGREMVLRRSRGYAPAPIKTPVVFKQQILACGAELKNTFCLTRDKYAFLSHHIGDLENLETLKSFTDGINHFKKLFHLQPEVVAYDLHPEYLSTKYALALADHLTKVGVQHHHAHICSCLADNNVQNEVIGIAMDGLGYGTDGRMWGGEFFVADFCDAERIAYLDYVPMPGGAKAIREPWRMAAVYLEKTFGASYLDLNLKFNTQVNRRDCRTISRMVATNTNSPETSSMGRLFDAVSSMLGLRNQVNYEGQAAIELETIADRSLTRGYCFDIHGAVISAEAVVRKAVEDLLNGESPGVVSARFHLAVVDLIVSMACRIREERRIDRVAMSGGVFQNRFLLNLASAKLRSSGFEVFTHSRVPPNDGGISLGQAVVANARLISGRI